MENQKAFTAETVTLISAFLNHLRKPICLLAHNGNKFDFPLLVAELKRINQSLDKSLLCADTLEAFRSLDGLPARYEPSSNHNTPIKNTTVPNKCVSAAALSPMKRKGTSDLETFNNKSLKVSRQDKDHEGSHSSSNSNMSVEKAKKKLDFKELKTDLKKEYEGKDDTANKDTVENAEIAGEFSGSLEDDDYLLALDSVEKSICEEKLVLSDSGKQSETVNRNINDLVTGGKVHSYSVNTASSELSVPVKPCSVANGTGYLVIHNTDGKSYRKETISESKDTSIDRSRVSSGVLPISLDRNTLLACKAVGSVFNNRSDSHTTDSVNIKNITTESDQKSSDETKFSVALMTLRPVKDTVEPSNTNMNTPKTEVSLSEVSKSPASVSKSANLLDFNCKNCLSKTSETISGLIDESDVTNGPGECSNVSSETPMNVTNSTASLGFSPMVKTLKIESQQNPVDSDVSDPAQLSSTNHASRCSLNLLEGSSVSSKLQSPLISEVSVQTSSATRTSVAAAASASGSFQSSLSSSPSKLDSASATSNPPVAKTGPVLATSSPALVPSVPALATSLPALASSCPALAAAGSNVSNSSPGLQRQSYKLEEIYLRKFGCKPLQSHKAEDDCITMVKVAKCSKRFLEWVDRNAVLLTSIKAPF